MRKHRNAFRCFRMLEGIIQCFHRTIFAAVMLLAAQAAFAKDNLAILPFTGGRGEEGETIAELFSFEPRLNEVFNPIPRTTIAQAVSSEQNFQSGTGLTDADTGRGRKRRRRPARKDTQSAWFP